jgi:hypothetical protein
LNESAVADELAGRAPGIGEDEERPYAVGSRREHRRMRRAILLRHLQVKQYVQQLARFITMQMLTHYSMMHFSKSSTMNLSKESIA